MDVSPYVQTIIAYSFRRLSDRRKSVAGPRAQTRPKNKRRLGVDYCRVTSLRRRYARFGRRPRDRGRGRVVNRGRHCRR